MCKCPRGQVCYARPEGKGLATWDVPKQSKFGKSERTDSWKWWQWSINNAKGQFHQDIRSTYVHVSMCPCLHVYMFTCVHVYMFTCLHVSMYVCMCACVIITSWSHDHKTWWHWWHDHKLAKQAHVIVKIHVRILHVCIPGLCQSLRYFSKSPLQEGLNGRRKTTHSHYPEPVVSADAYKNTITPYGRGTDTLIPVIHPLKCKLRPHNSTATLFLISSLTLPLFGVPIE